MKEAMLQRASNFELLRLVAMVFIVCYHLIIWFVYPSIQTDVWVAYQFPLHVGVVLFVLLSGYWGIRFSKRGLVRLISYMFAYTCVIGLIFSGLHGGGKYFLFISQSPYWYMRTYLYLYLTAPLINIFIEHATDREKWCLLAALAIICMYVGVVGSDPSLIEGKHLTNFYMLYLLGHLIRTRQPQVDSTSSHRLVALYVVLNVGIVFLYMYCGSDFLRMLLYKFGFYYCSPVLIVNAVLLFLIFSRIRFQSRVVNYLASSCLAVYLLHGSPVAIEGVFRPVAGRIMSVADSDICLFGVCLVCAVCITAACIAIDKLMAPLWILITRFV